VPVVLGAFFELTFENVCVCVCVCLFVCVCVCVCVHVPVLRAGSVWRLFRGLRHNVPLVGCGVVVHTVLRRFSFLYYWVFGAAPFTHWQSHPNCDVVRANVHVCVCERESVVCVRECVREYVCVCVAILS